MDIEHTLTTPKIIWIPLTICLALASISSKFAGAAWAWLLIAGLVSLWITRISARDTLPDPLTHDLARTWLMFTALAFLLKAIPMLYWHDPWAERHAELRLLLGAVGLYGITRLYGLSHQALRYLAIAGIVYCAAGLSIILFFGHSKTPTNIIPWAASVSLISCWLLSLVFIDTESPKSWRWFVLAGSTIGLLTVLVTEKRGAYGLAIVLPCMGLLLWRQQTVSQPTSLKIQKHWKIYVTCVLLGIVGLWSIKNTSLIERPVYAINLAIKEFKSSQASLAKNYNSNVGARLYLWAQTAKAIPESPWVGYGHDQRKQLLKQWAIDTQLPDAPVFGHVHSDYLHTLLDHGLWGLASFLSYAVGLMVLTLKLMRHKAKAHAIGLTGILLMHLTTALSNVNLAHNYYPTILSLVICITLWSAKGSSKTTTAP